MGKLTQQATKADEAKVKKLAGNLVSFIMTQPPEIRVSIAATMFAAVVAGSIEEKSRLQVLDDYIRIVRENVKGEMRARKEAQP